MDSERERFEELVRRCQTAVCAVAYARVRDRGHSEEIAQEAFLVAWLRRGDTTPSVGWICGIARNLARNARRRPQEVTMSVEPSGRDPRDELIERERTNQALLALTELSDRHREAVVLYYRGDESLAVVAEALGITEVAARQRVHRGRAKLREALASVELALRRSKPGAAFTAAVIAAWLIRGRDAAAATTATATTGTTIGTYALFGGIAAGGLGVIGTIVAAATGAFASAPSARTASAGGETAMRAETAPVARVQTAAASGGRGAVAATLPPSLQPSPTMDLTLRSVPVEVLIGLCGDTAGIPIMVDPAVPVTVTDIQGQGLDPMTVLDQTLAQIHAQRTEVEAVKLVFGGRSDASALGGDPVTIHVTNWPIGSALRLLAWPLHMPIGGYANLPPPNPGDTESDEPIVSLDVDNVPAGVALEKLLAETNLGYEFVSGYRVTVKSD